MRSPPDFRVTIRIASTHIDRANYDVILEIAA
jgi:hypothetical protein